MSTGTQYVYRFSREVAEGDRHMKALLGGKGANLAEMSALGLPVPPGFTITTEACRYVNQHDGRWPDGLEEQVEDGLHHVEEAMQARLGDADAPLLLSVRSGAAQSMPGMMDTVLNLGLNAEVVRGLTRQTGSERFALDAYRRLVDMFGHVVMGVDHQHFEAAIERAKKQKGVENDVDLDADDLRALVDDYKAIYREHAGEAFPEDPHLQLRKAIGAVFGSWNNDRAVTYRRLHQITGLLGTAVNVQAMVFGNRGESSGTGVFFTRSPATGENVLYGEFLQNAQGEDVVAGIRTPRDIGELREVMPAAYEELQEVAHTLEQHYRDMEDVEFTVQEGTLYILQTRDGKRTGPAALRIATEMVDEGLVDEDRAVRHLVEPRHLEQLLHPRFEDEAAYEDQVIGKGLAASPGAAVGRVVFSADDAEQWHQDGEQVILVRIETDPDDIGGMNAAQGILTARGGMTSHAAVVARGWGKPCVAGCDAITIDYDRRVFTAGDETVAEGDWISINGSTGEVVLGKQPVTDPEMSDAFARFMTWVRARSDLDVRANADTPEDAQHAVDFGAHGIGLCRTEHMFFGEERIQKMRTMILAEDEDSRRTALDDLLPYQRDDFRSILRVLDGRPLTVRLLDPPLHEFLPKSEEEQQELAELLGRTPEHIRDHVQAMTEVNPMLGHRGCRLGVTFPAITEMQVRALVEAALDLQDEGIPVQPEIMVPLVSTAEEVRHQKRVIEETAALVCEERGAEVDLLVGTMIETPRAALEAEAIAAETDFFSFGTNDLTQMTFGFSRDDATSFLQAYLDRGVLPEDPFQTIDPEGVGRLLRLATEQGRAAKETLEVGICGEHGGDPRSVAFCYEAGLDYVSCSPFRVPIAFLAAAQAHLDAAQPEPAQA